ncbi:MAG TPA: hypothetical protein DCE08_06760 [Ruminococcaceae bacterium]|nr:hypothetical protein [Oscillospiraceae bacterium]
MKKATFVTAVLMFAMMILSSCALGSKDDTPKINYSRLNCEAVSSFSDGVQWVTRREVTYNSDTQLYGLIDEKGNFLIEMTDEYADVNPFCNDAAWVKSGKISTVQSISTGSI